MMGKKKDKEYGSAANLIDNAEKVAALGRGNSTMSDKRKNFSRTQSRTSEFETVKIQMRHFETFFKHNFLILGPVHSQTERCIRIRDQSSSGSFRL